VKAAVFAREGTVEIQDVPEPTLSNDRDVIVRVVVCGICGSDIRALHVPPLMQFTEGVVMGHEFVGEVVQAGRASSHLVGKRVVAVPNVHCGRCAYCKANEVHHCENFEHLGATVDGAFAELCVVPGELTHLVPDELDSDVAALAEPLACVLNATQRARWMPGSPAVILGAGPIGLLFVIVAKAAGAYPVIVSEPSSARAESARQAGADVVVDPTVEPLREAVRAATDGLGAHVVVDAVGTLLDSALECLRKGGQILIFGLDDTARTTIAPSLIATRELSIEGSYITRGTFPLALALLTERQAQFRALITDRVELDDVAEGVAAMRVGRAVKVLVRPPAKPGVASVSHKLAVAPAGSERPL
jgi:2-desacetyl-2-hydroxyethyl bacteriochlorophyllide A dehydrogenase